ncbi:MAG: transposase [Candidatus Omnitrophica bacterium]|nr:transposase [Candidatus Omnitrophota bacterium]MDD5654606.1 transposase [Candidatus Omnitrophota bacterium]
MVKTRLLISSACYHIYARGNQRQRVFINRADYIFYLSKLKLYKKRYSIALYGYCLMPNHIHLIIEPHDPYALPRFMQCLHRSYTAYYNREYKKVGHVWQGRFKDKVITKDEYMIGCIAYVEQNPIRANLAQHIGLYEFSSYPERNYDNVGFKMLDKLIL